MGQFGPVSSDDERSGGQKRRAVCGCTRGTPTDSLISYPFLRNNTQSPAPGAESFAALSVGTFAGEFSNATAGEDYGTVEIPATEAADVQTENLTVTLAINGTGETFTFTGTNDTAVLRNETRVLPFDVGVIDQADTYTATVTVHARSAGRHPVRGGRPRQKTRVPLHRTRGYTARRYRWRQHTGGTVSIGS